MSESNPVTGRPYGGRDEKPDDEQQLPGEHPVSDDDVTAPGSKDREDDETASRAAEGGAMTSRDPQQVRPSPGVPGPVDAPSPADATDADPPGGSAANQRGRVPDE